MAFEYKIEKNILTLNDGQADWNLELNLISWNGRKASYDLRKWSPDHEKMGKGVTMSEDEVVKLFQHAGDILKTILGDDAVTPVIQEEEDTKLPFD